MLKSERKKKAKPTGKSEDKDNSKDIPVQGEGAASGRGREAATQVKVLTLNTPEPHGTALSHQPSASILKLQLYHETSSSSFLQVTRFHQQHASLSGSK